jgi:hypothetical protein
MPKEPYIARKIALYNPKKRPHITLARLRNGKRAPFHPRKSPTFPIKKEPYIPHKTEPYIE